MNEATEPGIDQPVVDQVDQKTATFSDQEADQDRQIDYVDLLKQLPITLIPEADKIFIEGLRDLVPDKNILLCDAYIQTIETGERDSVGFLKDGILNIDHHAPVEEMSRQVSSANLAIQYVLEKGVVPKDWVTIINHTDCDSVLSSAIMRGILEPLKEFGDAAIAADHTGEPNPIGDLLQSLQAKRDIEFSLRNLQLLRLGKPLEAEAQALLQERLLDRERAKALVESEFKTNQSGEVSYASIDKKLDAGLLPALLPNAKVILTYSPFIDKETTQAVPGRYEVKSRLGMTAPSGTDLRRIMTSVDPAFGGRWNAGSNKRSGGTTIDMESYVQAIEAELPKQST